MERERERERGHFKKVYKATSSSNPLTRSNLF